jgi:hypothetical protein
MFLMGNFTTQDQQENEEEEGGGCCPGGCITDPRSTRLEETS